jgi:hypothetical protein
MGSAVEVGRELLAAIGEVVIEATKLEYALAHLVAVRWGWSAEHERAMSARSGAVREQVTKLVEADPDWTSMHRLRRDALAVLDDRHVLVHSLVLYAEDVDNDLPGIELWHPKSDTSAALPTANAVEELAFDIDRCFAKAARMVDEAGERYQRLGAADAPQPPKLLPTSDPPVTA